ncbi:MAG TPA: S41 family peptidase, partial [Pyrinomonadaceae bacterium]|nr:S41 family peptidase [Pyrinomonadaceae bacterium]
MKRLTTIIYLSIIMTLVAPSSVAAQNGREQPDGTIDAATRAQVIETILKRLNDAYVFPEVAQNMEKSIRERMSKKEYDQINSSAAFAETLTTHLREVSKDKHLGVRYSHEPLPSPGDRREPSAEERERMRNFGAGVNYGFEKIERMGGNIGYLNLRGFFDPEMGGDTVAAAMNFLSNTDALIIDLRQNGGGDPAMVQLISTYLFTGEPIHLNSLYWRPGNRTQEFWTLPY